MFSSRWDLSILALMVMSPVAVGQTPDSTARTTTSCAGSLSTDTTVFELSQVTEAPVLQRMGRLLVPNSLRRTRRQFRVLLTLVVNADGRVDSSSVAIVDRGHREFDAEAVRAAKTATWSPGCRYERPARVRVQFPVQFAGAFILR